MVKQWISGWMKGRTERGNRMKTKGKREIRRKNRRRTSGWVYNERRERKCDRYGDE